MKLNSYRFKTFTNPNYVYVD